MTDRAVTIAVDANGADRGAREVALGAAAAVAADPGLRVIVAGPQEELGPLPDRVEALHAPVSVAKAPDPARAVRAHPDASIVQAVQAVADGRADAFVSGGSTGAALAAALFRIKRARGIHRPALALVVPVPGRPFVLLDAGANVDVRPEHLVQFAHMGAAFASVALGLERPRVALLSNGTEPSKGTEDVIAAHAQLAAAPGRLDFAGNVEGFAIGGAEVDVMVADGFTGNVALKVMEGTSKALLDAVRSAVLSSARAKAGGLLLKPALRGLRDALDPEEQGGAVLLGLRRPGVVPHGSFGARGFESAIALAARIVRDDLAGRTHAALAEAGALRRAPDASAAPATVPDR